MSDQIQSATVQPDANGNVINYQISYLFDNGAGANLTQNITVPAGTGDTVTAMSAATLASANALAYAAKQAWIASLAIPAQVPLPALVGPVTLVAAQ